MSLPTQFKLISYKVMYKKNKIYNYLIIFSLCCTTFFTSCIREEHFNNDPEGNFEALWKIIDEGYCFLDYKEINWDSIYYVYKKRISPTMSNEALFEVLGDMLEELKDGHVNLSWSANQSRYWNWYEDYPRNFNEGIQEDYLGTNYRIAGGVKYTILDDNIGYLYYSSFMSGLGNGNLDHILDYLSICNGLIVDVRHNGGGILTNSTRFASRFTNKKTLVGYIQHKTGPGHNDFSKPKAQYINPTKGIRWQKKTVVLTNRRTFSAANDFVNNMRYFENVITLGDNTGGGSGLPFSSELPNGWSVRYSASPHYDAEMNQIEFGIEPDIKVDMNIEDELKGIDTLIEEARKILNKK